MTRDKESIKHFHRWRILLLLAIVPVSLVHVSATSTLLAFLCVGSSCRFTRRNTRPELQLFHRLEQNHRDGFVGLTTIEDQSLYNELHEQVVSVANDLWGEDQLPSLDLDELQGLPSSQLMEGEAELPSDISFSDRGEYFRTQALKGHPRAQHSYGLLLWSGFAATKNPEESAKFHAAAACQHHLDGMAVFGGCLRTGTGIPKTKKKNTKTNGVNRVALGLKLIEFCASVGNPSGVNKKAALLESNGNDFAAVDLYENALKSGRTNALVKFNLGWSLVNGQGVDKKDDIRGIAMWKEATEMAPDEGSEEAAWNLYQEHIRENPQEAGQWLGLAEDLGYYE